GQEIANTRAYYRPFGGFADRSHPPDMNASGFRQFTAKELDGSGLYDFGARLYDAETGRFTQADDIQLDQRREVQHRYSYAFNQPLRNVDPSGHWPISTACCHLLDPGESSFKVMGPEDLEFNATVALQAIADSTLGVLQPHRRWPPYAGLPIDL